MSKSLQSQLKRTGQGHQQGHNKVKAIRQKLNKKINRCNKPTATRREKTRAWKEGDLIRNLEPESGPETC